MSWHKLYFINIVENGVLHIKFKVYWLIVLRPTRLQSKEYMDMVIQPFQWKIESILAYSTS